MHTERKTVYGHQIVVCILRCEKTILHFDMILHNKNILNKTDIALKVISVN
ncbi:MAG: hypothetical protein ABF289_14800 [Clostridiales bacterium]